MGAHYIVSKIGQRSARNPFFKAGHQRPRGRYGLRYAPELFAAKSFNAHSLIGLRFVEGLLFGFAFCLRGWSLRPRSSALQRPVRTRHQSTAKLRAIATMIFLRRGRLVLGL